MRTTRLLKLILPGLLILAGCQQGQPVRDTSPAPPDWQEAAPGWLPIHRKPRMGDFAVHQQLDASGLTPTRRRSEVLAVDGQQVEIRQTYNQPNSPAMHYILDRQGLVRSAWVVPAGQSGRQSRMVLPAVRRHRKQVRDKAPLPLASGDFPVSEIVSRTITLDNGRDSRQVDYLSADIPFQTLVSLSGRRAISHHEAVRLIGRIAVLKSPNEKQRASIPITDGWVLMQWGRGKGRRR